ncbi:MAG: hypothetical protein MHMPM18_004620, partial [Marteilia pararefringens]
ELRKKLIRKVVLEDETGANSDDNSELMQTKSYEGIPVLTKYLKNRDSQTLDVQHKEQQGKRNETVQAPPSNRSIYQTSWDKSHCKSVEPYVCYDEIFKNLTEQVHLPIK